MSSLHGPLIATTAKKIAPRLCCSMALVLIVSCVALPMTLAAQTAAPTAAQAGSTTVARATATATRAAQRPAIDGIDADAAWADATPITAFRQIDPAEDAE